MSVYRKNMITNDWVIFAPNRASRPMELKSKDSGDNVDLFKERPVYKPSCPFCPGNEKPEDRELFRIGNGDHWKVRILENKYSSVDRNVEPVRRQEHLFKEMDGFGIHDVIVENPAHNKTLAIFTHEELLDLLQAYLERAKQIKTIASVRHIVIFKNQGSRAGGSLEHPHSQIYGLPLVPFETQIRLREMDRYHDINDNCMLCDMIKGEQERGARIIYQNEHFVCLSPFAALSPYHFWVMPKKHSPSFLLTEPEEMESLADCMKTIFGKLFVCLRNPDFNYVFQSLAMFERERHYFHWYLSVIPQVKHKGGLEYAGGFYVNPVMPETAALELRNADASLAAQLLER